MCSTSVHRDFFDNLQEPNSFALSEQLFFNALLKPHSYTMTKDEVDRVFRRPIYKRIIESKVFQRLKRIHFLGSIDYVDNPRSRGRRDTRYQHSLGVARLALQFSIMRKLPENQEIICVISALLHDIGHAPLSHSLESVFVENYGISHHLIAEKILRGDKPFDRSIHLALNEFNINLFEVLVVINGTGTKPYSEIFNHEINIDTIEGILRSSTYIFKNQKLWSPHEVLNALANLNIESTPILDSFWKLKGDVYHQLINSKTGVLADYICKDYMRENKTHFLEDYYYLTEGELEKKQPLLFTKLRNMSKFKPCQLLPNTFEITFIKRNFHINSDVLLDTVWAIDKRYTQTKSKETYQVQPRVEQ